MIENSQENNSKNSVQENEPQEKQNNYNFNQITFLQSLEPLELKIYNIFRNILQFQFLFLFLWPPRNKRKNQLFFAYINYLLNI